MANSDQKKIVPQVFDDGRYTSDILLNRYQIFESTFYKGNYLVYDHNTQEIVRAKNGDYFQVFDTIGHAEKYIGIANSDNQTPKKKSEGKKLRRESQRGESALSYMKFLISDQPTLSNDEIAQMVKEKYPTSNYNHSMVKFNRKKLGLN